MIRKKTAILFETCTHAAAISTRASQELATHLSQLGDYIGICFQIKDDIFDYSDSSEIGKPTGNDMIEGKLTLPVLYVLNQKKDAWATSLAHRIKEGTASSEEIASLIDYTKKNGGIEYAEEVMHNYRQKAIDILNQFPDSPIKDSLNHYINYVIDRSK